METNHRLMCRPLYIEFKSYYVVWKPFPSEQTKKSNSGLNRTMQYGNFPQKQTIDDDRSSLNRTMQYGNYF